MGRGWGGVGIYRSLVLSEREPYNKLHYRSPADAHITPNTLGASIFRYDTLAKIEMQFLKCAEIYTNIYVVRKTFGEKYDFYSF